MTWLVNTSSMPSRRFLCLGIIVLANVLVFSVFFVCSSCFLFCFLHSSCGFYVYAHLLSRHLGL